jgi:2-dehydropantoate 2-reductase
MTMKACIYGAGAIGGWLGVALAQAGHTVSLVARGETLRALQTQGLRMRRTDGTLAQVPVTAHSDPAALGVQDLVVIAVKAPACRTWHAPLRRCWARTPLCSPP